MDCVEIGYAEGGEVGDKLVGDACLANGFVDLGCATTGGDVA